MTLLSLILALLLEQLRPLPAQGLAMRVLRGLVAGIGRRFDDGAGARGRIAWVIVVLPVTLAAAIGYWLLWETLPVLAFVFNVVVLYVCMGFRHDSGLLLRYSRGTAPRRAGAARAFCSRQWRGARYDDASPSEVARLAIEEALVVSHRRLFGVMFWFVLLPGPSGAVMYRLAGLLAEEWGGRMRAPRGFGRFARRAREAIEWLPVRITASCFRSWATSRTRSTAGARRRCCGRRGRRLY
jgi:adenosylcobinamide-phosphate synthase